MPLSENEQRLLDEIEKQLEAEDPKLASAVRSTDLRTVARRRTRYAAILFIVGLTILVGGFVRPVSLAGIPIVGVVGFLLMFAAAIYGFGQYKRASGADLRVVDSFGSPRPPRAQRARSGPRRTTRRDGGLVNRLEQRFLERFDR